MTTINSTLGADLEPADPASVGVSARGLADLKSQVNAMITKGERAGLVYAIARKGKIVALEALGKRDLERDLPMEKNTAFRIYSMSRAVTSAAALTLIDEQKLRLDDPVMKYIPSIANMKVIKQASGNDVVLENQSLPMTVRHLFTYTSGLGYANDWPKSFNFQQRNVLDPDVTLADGIENLTTYPLLYQPGAKWHYGFSGDVLGRVAEIASGQPLDAFLKARLFERIGMRDTGFWISEADAQKHRLAEVYSRRTATDQLTNTTATATPLSHFTRPGKLFSAGGGLVSTVPDYLRFTQMLLNGGVLDGQKILNPETVRMMLSQQTTADQGAVYWYAPGQFTSVTGYYWGLAIGVRPNNADASVPGKPGEVGWSGLANTFFLINLKEQVVAVVMAQYQGINGNDLSTIFRSGVYGALE